MAQSKEELKFQATWLASAGLKILKHGLGFTLDSSENTL